jgi:hypothetical protein
MLVTLIFLAIIMAALAVIGYLHGARATVFLTVVILCGLLLISRAGGSLAKLINGIYIGILFVLNGGLQALSSADRSAAITVIFQKIGSPRLTDPNSPGPELLLILLALILIAIWLGRSERFRLRGPTSVWGFLFGLLNGYLLGAYLLDSIFPANVALLPLPFGINQQLHAGPIPCCAPATNANVIGQLVSSIQNASETTLAMVVMVIIAVFILMALLGGSRRARRSGRNGTS